MLRYPLLCALAVLLVSCGDGLAGTGSDDLSGRTFLSRSVSEDGAARELVEDTRISVRFHEDGRLTASAGCNMLHAEPTITDDTLEVGGVEMSTIGCDQPLHDQDAWLAGFLESSPAWALEGDELTLSATGTEIILLDR